MTTLTKPRTKLLTAADLLRLDAKGVKGELIRGVLCETMSAGITHGQVVINLAVHMGNYVKPRRLGRIVGSDAGILLERDPDTVREPDAAFISAEKLPLDTNAPGYLEGAPELVVEVFSPSDTFRGINDKAMMWLRYGVLVVWVVFPETQTVEVYLQDGSISSLGTDDTLDGGAAIPGFQLQVGDIFEI